MDWWACAHSSLFQDGVIEVRDLLRTLYETAVAKKQWGIVRHCAGYLGRRVDDLSKVCSHMQAVLIYHHIMAQGCVFPQAVTDMVVRQKQVTVGMPPYSEVVVSGQVPIRSTCTLSGDVEGKENMF